MSELPMAASGPFNNPTVIIQYAKNHPNFHRPRLAGPLSRRYTRNWSVCRLTTKLSGKGELAWLLRMKKA
jgi:hypothetical protein